MEISSAADYVKLMDDVIALGKNLIVIRNAAKVDNTTSLTAEMNAQYDSKRVAQRSHKTFQALSPMVAASGPWTIDVWLCPTGTNDSWNGEDPCTNSMILCMQYAHVLLSSKRWRGRTRLRILKLSECTDFDSVAKEHHSLCQYVERLRLKVKTSDIVLVQSLRKTSDGTTQKLHMASAQDARYYNGLFQEYSRNALHVFFELPMHDPSNYESLTAYLEFLELLTTKLPAVLLVKAPDSNMGIITTCI